MGSDERERHFNLHTTPEVMAGVYSNFATVSHSDYEFTLTFSRVDHEVEADEVPGVVVSRVTLSQKAMRELIDAMEDNWSKWQTREASSAFPRSRTARTSHEVGQRSPVASAWPIRSIVLGWVPRRISCQRGG